MDFFRIPYMHHRIADFRFFVKFHRSWPAFHSENIFCDFTFIQLCAATWDSTVYSPRVLSPCVTRPSPSLFPSLPFLSLLFPSSLSSLPSLTAVRMWLCRQQLLRVKRHREKMAVKIQTGVCVCWCLLMCVLCCMRMYLCDVFISCTNPCVSLFSFFLLPHPSLPPSPSLPSPLNLLSSLTSLTPLFFLTAVRMWLCRQQLLRVKCHREKMAVKIQTGVCWCLLMCFCVVCVCTCVIYLYHARTLVSRILSFLFSSPSSSFSSPFSLSSVSSLSSLFSLSSPSPPLFPHSCKNVAMQATAAENETPQRKDGCQNSNRCVQRMWSCDSVL